MKNWLKWWISGPELHELEYRRIKNQEVLRWFSKYPDITTIIENIERGIKEDGKRYLSIVDLRNAVDKLR